MKRCAMLAVLTIAAAAAAAPDRGIIGPLEKGFDAALASAAKIDDPVDLIGFTRGLYLDGYGAVFTAEVDLIQTPGLSPFRTEISPQLKESVHQRKLQHVPLVKDAMKTMMRSSALGLGSMPESEQIVVAVRMHYMPWENTTGLPGQIVMHSDRKSARLGDIKTEIE
jgi:hypothetical protein